MRKLIFTLLFLTSFQLFAEEVPIPELKGRVNDYANLLDEPTKLMLEELLKKHEDSTSNQVVILTVPKLGNFNIEYFSYKVASTWQLGTKTKDNGVLITIAPNNREMRIEVGKGLEGDLTDALSKRIIENDFIPFFKIGNYQNGIINGTSKVLDAIVGSYVYEEEYTENEAMPIWAGILIGTVLSLIIFTFLLLFASEAIINKNIPIMVFTFVWFGIFMGVFVIAFHWIFILLLVAYLVFLVASLFYPIKDWMLRFSFIRNLVGAKFDVKTNSWTVPISKGADGWSSSSSGGSSFSGGGGSFGGGGSSGRW